MNILPEIICGQGRRERLNYGRHLRLLSSSSSSTNFIATQVLQKLYVGFFKDSSTLRDKSLFYNLAHVY